jgi:hypothetical protein
MTSRSSQARIASLPQNYVTEHALALAGPVRETYLVGPWDTGYASAWRIEIGWPVFRTSAAWITGRAREPVRRSRSG